MDTAGLQRIDSHRLTEALARTPAEHNVIWTGHSPGTRSGSMRSRALACIREVGEPVPLRVLMSRAARISGDLGFDPDAVRSAVRTYQIARPAVYMLVRRLACGDFVAVTDIPYPAGAAVRIAAGDVVLGRGVRRFAVAEGASQVPLKVQADEAESGRGDLRNSRLLRSPHNGRMGLLRPEPLRSRA